MNLPATERKEGEEPFIYFLYHSSPLLSPDPDKQMELLLTFKRSELRRYSVWEQQEMETHDLLLKVDLEHPPPAALLFCVSDAAAADVQQELLKLCVPQRGGNEAGERKHTHSESKRCNG